jgi:hypothetical protein
MVRMTLWSYTTLTDVAGHGPVIRDLSARAVSRLGGLHLHQGRVEP